MRKSDRLTLATERRRLERLWRQRQADLQHWRRTLRPACLRLLTDRAATLGWSRALLSLLLNELHVDVLFTTLVGNPRHLPVRRFPQAVAVAIALRHSWRPDDLSHLARRLGIALSTHDGSNNTRAAHAGHHRSDCGARRRAVKALRVAPTPFGADGLDRGAGRARRRLLRDDPDDHPRRSPRSRS